MTTALLIAALVLAVIDEFRSKFVSLLGWAVVLIAAALLIGRLG